MLISRGEFRRRRIDLSLAIAELLADNSELGFTVDEVRRLLIETSGINEDLTAVEHGLETLVSQGRAETAEIDGEQWYTIAERRLGFL